MLVIKITFSIPYTFTLFFFFLKNFHFFLFSVNRWSRWFDLNCWFEWIFRSEINERYVRVLCLSTTGVWCRSFEIIIVGECYLWFEKNMEKQFNIWAIWILYDVCIKLFRPSPQNYSFFLFFVIENSQYCTCSQIGDWYIY